EHRLRLSVARRGVGAAGDARVVGLLRDLLARVLAGLRRRRDAVLVHAFLHRGRARRGAVVGGAAVREALLLDAVPAAGAAVLTGRLRRPVAGAVVGHARVRRCLRLRGAIRLAAAIGDARLEQRFRVGLALLLAARRRRGALAVEALLKDVGRERIALIG